MSKLGSFLQWLLGLFFPSLKSPDPITVAAKQEARADALQSQLRSKDDADAARDTVRARSSVLPNGMRDDPANLYRD